MNPIVNQGLWVASGLFLFVVAWVRFYLPPTNRSGTTFLLFCSGVVFYYALLVALWLLVILLLTSGGYGLDELARQIGIALEKHQELSPSLPVVAALIITVASQFRQLRKLDTAARSFCMALAAIPREADQLAMELAQGAEFHAVNQKLIDSVTREITQNIGGGAVNFENDGTAEARFTRAVSLYWLFVMPDSSNTTLAFPTNAGARSTYSRIMQVNDKVVDQAARLYDTLMETGLAYFTASKPTRHVDEALKRSIQDLSYVVCSLIARYVLSLDVTPTQRRMRLAAMGFNPRDYLPAFGRDQWMASIFAIAVLFTALSVAVPESRRFIRPSNIPS
jgi:hypothetical protein